MPFCQECGATLNPTAAFCTSCGTAQDLSAQATPVIARPRTEAELIYPNEPKLGKITLALGLLAWLGLVVGTFGGALVALALGFVGYVFLQSAFIAHIKGNGVELSETQYPDLYAQFLECCERLQIKEPPQAYVLNGNGALNAFATKFLGKRFVVLLSNVVDAMDKHADGVRFYIGHELGHLRRKHLEQHLLRWPVLWLPLLGAAYARACECTCDRHGLACSNSPEGAALALAALASGPERWKRLDVPSYVKQATHASGFWMSFHELTSGYPWLTKRASRVFDPNAPTPPRHGLAYVLALFFPYAGRLGAGFGLLILVYVVGVLAAIAVPAYQEYTAKNKLAAAYEAALPARAALGDFYQSRHAIPESLEAAAVQSRLPDGSTLDFDSKDMTLTVKSKQGELIFTPTTDSEGRVVWSCRGGEKVKAAHVPVACHE